MKNQSQKGRQLVFLNGGIAIAYIIAIQISHAFTTLPGEVASVWFPSAITLPMVYYYGTKVFSGIIIGSIIGLIPALSSLDPPLSLINSLLLNTICIIANCLQPWLARYLLNKFSRHQEIFTHLSSVLVFIVASFFAPLISAMLGVTGLLIVNALTIGEYPLAFITWWLASALAHILFSPPVIIYREKEVLHQKASYGEIIINLSILCVICIIIFQFAYPLEYLLLPILIWGVFRLNRWNSSLLVSFVAFVAITATGKGYGIFVKSSVNESLMLLQSFTAMLSLTTLILSAVLSERQIAQQSLKETLENLEIKVFERTRELTQAQLNLKHANYTLEKMANTDSLTQVANRRYFDRTLEKEWNKAIETQQSLSLLLIDIDCFKQYNDTYGHPQGDECLIQVAQTFKSVIRHDYDCVARYGGEEFAVILPNTNLKEAKVVALKIIEKIRQLEIEHRTSTASNFLTLSIGISVSNPQLHDSLDDFIQKADQALYQAKKQGRDRFVIYYE
ncbi:sensor domain-containing diguanylate cyclase [Cyanobacterium aponinum]|uniref:Diguanylate cyclase n=1 Tax=Cyanobacterium aponinum 0216 TaxID=2676140 RepID=A0A844GVY4_9CHRO|nr:diguanylate cyclase [Cyanobacterium aponinum]MTF39202.1 diguanylate cyclase [Cyanobacterium aponinum 0216]